MTGPVMFSMRAPYANVGAGARTHVVVVVVIGRNPSTTLGGVLGGSAAPRLIQDGQTPVCVVPGAVSSDAGLDPEPDDSRAWSTA
jgi:hypothetical protein